MDRRTRAVAAAVIALGAAGHVGAGARGGEDPKKDDFPLKVRLAPGRDKRERSFHYALPAGVTAAPEPKIMTAKIGEKDLLFADIDGNGRFGDLGIDGWIVDSPMYRAFLPVEKSIVLDRTLVHLQFATDGPIVRFRLETPDLPEVPAGLTAPEAVAARDRIRDLEAALQEWNRLRLRSGLPPAFLDPVLTRGAMLHAAYMEKWGRGHGEIAGNEGYTEEGERSGKNSSVGPAPAKSEVHYCYRSLYHRLMLFHPDLRRVGIGVSARFSALDGLSAREERPWKWPVLVPAPGNDLVPLDFAGEQPPPHPGVLKDQRQAGFPITLLFPDTKVTGAEADLRIGGADGAPVEVLVSSPEKPANSKQPTNFKSICVIPVNQLRPATTYTVSVRYKWNGEDAVRRWSFKTLSPLGPR